MNILTKSGGSVGLISTSSPISWSRLILHIDQSTNIKNGEDEASIVLTVDECKDLIAGLNEYIRHMDGQDYVLTTQSVVDLMSNPEVQDLMKKLEENGTIKKFEQKELTKRLLR